MIIAGDYLISQLPDLGSIEPLKKTTVKNILILSVYFIIPFCAVCQPFITTWKTDNPGSSNSTSITISVCCFSINYDVDWDNDGIFDQFGITRDVTHDFGIAGTYTIAIQGSFPRLNYNGGGDIRKLVAIEQWGNNAWTGMHRAFSGASNMIYNATDVPNLSNVTDMSRMFSFCSLFNGDLSSWDVSNVNNMRQLFVGATLFNGNIQTWNVSNVEDMEEMFSYTNTFNQDLDMWDVSSVTSMKAMFLEAIAFNQNLDSWDVSSVSSMQEMFSGATAFDGNISSWDVSSVTFMNGMFTGATAFNSNISSWNTSSVLNMGGLFDNATSFDQNLGNWDLSSVFSMSSMLRNSGLSISNYDNSLIGWEAQGVSNINFENNNGLIYCNGQAARNVLISTYNWQITGDAFDCSSLPVELSDFTAQVQPQKIIIHWTTTSETNNQGFYIQRSSDGKAWQSLGFIAGQGTTTSPSHYEYLDPQPQKNINYYRLQQFDFDGAFEYSKTIAVAFENTGQGVAMQVYPNPTTGTLTLSLDNPSQQPLQMTIHNSLGQLVWQSTPTAVTTQHQERLQLEAGLYYVSAKVGQQVGYERVVVE